MNIDVCSADVQTFHFVDVGSVDRSPDRSQEQIMNHTLSLSGVNQLTVLAGAVPKASLDPEALTNYTEKSLDEGKGEKEEKPVTEEVENAIRYDGLNHLPGVEKSVRVRSKFKGCKLKTNNFCMNAISIYVLSRETIALSNIILKEFRINKAFDWIEQNFYISIWIYLNFFVIFKGTEPAPGIMKHACLYFSFCFCRTLENRSRSLLSQPIHSEPAIGKYTYRHLQMMFGNNPINRALSKFI